MMMPVLLSHLRPPFSHPDHCSKCCSLVEQSLVEIQRVKDKCSDQGVCRGEKMRQYSEGIQLNGKLQLLLVYPQGSLWLPCSTLSQPLLPHHLLCPQGLGFLQRTFFLPTVPFPRTAIFKLCFGAFKALYTLAASSFSNVTCFMIQYHGLLFVP